MFDWNKIAISHQEIAKLYIGELRLPDYSFLPGKDPYQFRWYVAPKQYHPLLPALFLHIMIRDDPTDELHDHNWHNTSLVLGGRMIETYGRKGVVHGRRHMTQGIVIARRAEDTHSLRLDGCPYAMTLFAVGPKIMDNHYYKIEEDL